MKNHFLKLIHIKFLNNQQVKFFASQLARERKKLRFDKIEKLKAEISQLREESGSDKKFKNKEIDSYDPVTALSLIRQNNILDPLNQKSIQLTIGLNINPKRGEQNVRGVFKTPGGANRIPKLMVFTSPGLEELAKKAGADLIANDETYKLIQDGEYEIDFDKCICTTDVINRVKTLGKVLGPKGLMPSLKVGTIVPPENLESVIKDFKTGSYEFKNDNRAQVIIPIGQINFEDNKILRNLDSFLRILWQKRHESVKGRFISYAYLTYSKAKKSYKLNPKSLELRNPRYFGNDLIEKKVINSI